MALRRRQWRVRAAGDQFEINLPAAERNLLAQLLPQLREIVEGPTDDRSRRLFPTAYLEDQERDDEYQRFMRHELVASRLASLDMFMATAEASTVDQATLLGWMQSINAVRLVLGTLLDVSEEMDPTEVSEKDPSYADYALYGYLSALLDEIVTALSGE